MRLYLEVARRSFQRHLAYRGATLAGLVANSVFGVLLASVYRAFYESRGDGSVVEGFDLPQILTFIWIGQSMIMVVYMWGWWEVSASIQSGDVVTDLMKPLDYFGFWLSRDLGRAVCHMLTRFIPTILIGGLLYDLALPGLSWRWLAWGISIVLAVVVSFAFRFIMNLTAFWLLDTRGVHYLSLVATNFFSGFLVPLDFLPNWLRVITELLPFRAIIMLPAEVALGQRNVGVALALQLFWAIALMIAGRALLAKAVRKLEVQGG